MIVPRHRPSSQPSRGPLRRAFTLVELLVVIGIIALLISILLPTLNSARESAKSVACSSNLRQIALGAIGYANDQKTLPWGLWSQRFTSNPGTPVLPRNTFMIWPAAVSGYLNSGDYDVVLGQQAKPDAYSQVLHCPSVGPEYDPPSHYQAHGIAMPDQFIEQNRSGITGGSPEANDITQPARLSQLYPDNALFWDTTCFGSVKKTNPDGTYSIRTFPSSAVIGMDNANFIFPAIPYLRYRNDDGSGEPDVNDPLEALDFPVAQLADRIAEALPGVVANGDVLYTTPGSNIYYIQVGNSVFRHNRSLISNTAFADGSVRGLRRYPNQPHPADPLYLCNSDMTRRNLRIKYPSLLPLAARR